MNGAESLALNGALGVERSIGAGSTVEVTNETLKVGNPVPRLRLGLSTTWRSGSYALRTVLTGLRPDLSRHRIRRTYRTPDTLSSKSVIE